MKPIRYPASRRVKDRRKASYALLSKISKDLEFLKERAVAMDAAEQKRRDEELYARIYPTIVAGIQKRNERERRERQYSTFKQEG